MKTAMAQTTLPAMTKGILWRGILQAILRRWSVQGGNVQNALRVAERLSLGSKKTLFLVECEGKKFLVAAGADTIVALTEVRSAPKRRKVESA
jgi:flagellar biogenesis protein FliO